MSLFNRKNVKVPEWLIDQYCKSVNPSNEICDQLIETHGVSPEFSVVKYWYSKWGYRLMSISMSECGDSLSLVTIDEKIIVWCKDRKIYGIVVDGFMVAENPKFSVLFDQVMRELVTI
nr:hypothetical protein K-LCC10_0435 [Kaumoebavirus]